MIHMITGAVNQGKSTYLCGIYGILQKGDGFYNRKIFQGDCLAGQEIVRLTTGESVLFSFKDRFIPENWHEECRFDAFSFSGEGLDFGRGILEYALYNYVSPLFIDEIGPLELAGEGFCVIFTKLLAASAEMYVVVRRSCIKNVINRFSIKKYEVIDIRPGV